MSADAAGKSACATKKADGLPIQNEQGEQIVPLRSVKGSAIF
jgi:hypothetical protein